MKIVDLKYIKIATTLILFLSIILPGIGQDTQKNPKLFIGGGALSENMYLEFSKLAGPDANLVVVPTASSREVDAEKIQKLWQSRGIAEVSVLHTRDRAVASSDEFVKPLKKATAVWFNGGSQQRIADAYLGTPVEDEIYQLLQRGGIIGGSSAGAAIQSKVMITGGKTEPKITSGMDLAKGVILDQHFLKRNRLSRLMSAVRTHPELIGFGIDEDTAIIVSGDGYKVIGASYVIRVEWVEGQLKIDAYENGDIIPISN